MPMTLPTPPAAFHWTIEPWGPMLRCHALDGIAQHGFTSRQLELRPGEVATSRWNAAAASVGCSVDRVRRIRQVHGAVVQVVDERPLDGAPPESDAAITAAAGVAVAVVAADCVPILLADRRTGAVAAIHAGWRGTAARVTEATVESLHREYRVDASQLVAAIGPSIGACCYEVGDDLLTAFAAAGFSSVDLAEWFARDRRSRLRLDLWQANADQLVHAGVPRAQVHVSGLCTKTHLEVFESFRAEGERAGRMAALIVAPPAVR